MTARSIPTGTVVGSISQDPSAESRPGARLVVQRTGAAWTTFGTPQLRRTGYPVEFWWRWTGERLEFGGHPLGMWPAYWHTAGDRLVVGERLHDVVEEAGALHFDDDAMAVLLRIGGFVGDDSPFREVRRMPPAGAFAWDGARWQLHAAPRVMPPPLTLSRTALITRYEELIRAAVARVAQATDEPIVPLTGGRDSRHLALEYLALGVRPLTLTVSTEPWLRAAEVKPARAVAEAFGLEHLVLHVSHDRMGTERRKDRLSNFEALEHFWSLPIRDFLAERAMPTLVDGIAGDTLTQAKFLTARRLETLRAGRIDAFLADAVGPDAAYLRALTPSLQARWSRERALARLAREVREHEGAANPVGSYRLWNRTRRTVGAVPFAIHGDVARIAAPYLDPEFLEFFRAVPAEMLVSGDVHTATLAHFFPHASNVAYAGAAPSPSGSTWGAHSWRLVRDVLRATGDARGASRTVLPLHVGYTALRRKTGPLAAYARLTAYLGALREVAPNAR